MRKKKSVISQITMFLNKFMKNRKKTLLRYKLSNFLKNFLVSCCWKSIICHTSDKHSWQNISFISVLMLWRKSSERSFPPKKVKRFLFKLKTRQKYITFRVIASLVPHPSSHLSPFVLSESHTVPPEAKNLMNMNISSELVLKVKSLEASWSRRRRDANVPQSALQASVEVRRGGASPSGNNGVPLSSNHRPPPRPRRHPVRPNRT